MSFFALLILLSLIIIVPIFFVIKEKSNRVQVDSTHRHQAYLASAASVTTEDEIMIAANETPSPLKIIEFSARHPFIQLLYNEQVPKEFRTILDTIGEQYERMHHEQITESQLFTLNKIIEQRIPELLTDYLSLDPNYAQTIVIDNEQSATAHVIVLEQLHSILDFAQQLNTQSQSGVVNKLLASRRYLEDVSQQSNLTNDILKIK